MRKAAVILLALFFMLSVVACVRGNFVRSVEKETTIVGTWKMIDSSGSDDTINEYLKDIDVLFAFYENGTWVTTVGQSICAGNYVVEGNHIYLGDADKTGAEFSIEGDTLLLLKDGEIATFRRQQSDDSFDGVS